MRYLVFCVICLAGCDMGGAGFRGVEPMRISIDGSQFSVRQSQGYVEVLRTNSEVAFQRRGMTGKMVQAIERTTGCALVKGSLKGDQVQATGRLKCAGKAVPVAQPVARTLYCTTPEPARRGDDLVILPDLDCY